MFKIILLKEFSNGGDFDFGLVTETWFFAGNGAQNRHGQLITLRYEDQGHRTKSAK